MKPEKRSAARNKRQRQARANATNHQSDPLAGLDKIVHFPEAKGKVLEDVEFFTSSDYDAISLSFRDKTLLSFVIDTCFSVQADYLDRKTGDHHVLKRWPPMHAIRFRQP